MSKISVNTSVIVFDLGNVLIPFDHQLIIERLEAVKKGLGRRFYDYYKSNYNIHRDFERGSIKKEDFLQVMLDVLDHRISETEFCRFYSEIFTLNDEVINLLPLLKSRYKLVLLSNTNSIHRDFGWGKYSFLDIFDKLILSYEVGAVKPEEHIYREAERFTSRPAEEHVFIDDIPEYANAARSLGWDAIVYKDPDDLRQQFAIRSII